MKQHIPGFIMGLIVATAVQSSLWVTLLIVVVMGMFNTEITIRNQK